MARGDCGRQPTSNPFIIKPGAEMWGIQHRTTEAEEGAEDAGQFQRDRAVETRAAEHNLRDLTRRTV